MKDFLALLASIALFFTACQTHPETPDKTFTLEKFYAQSNVPAAIMGGIDAEGKITWRAFGPAIWTQNDTLTPDHIFRIASMTKALTAVAAMQLVEAGKISLDEPLNDLLPEMVEIPLIDEFGNINSSEEPITLKQLLSHTSGFGLDFTSLILKNFQPKDWKYQDKPRLFEPGTSWKYGSSMDWVGKLIEKVSGQDLETYFRENITVPLNMNSTAYNLPTELHDMIVSWGAKNEGNHFREFDRVPTSQVASFSGGNGLFCSLRDFLTFLQCMLNYGEYEGGRILKKETVEMMTSNQLLEGVQMDYERFATGFTSIEGEFLDDQDEFGLGWAIEANKNDSIRPQGAFYWGGVANTYFSADVKGGKAVVYFSQFLPFNDKEAVEFFRLFEKEYYDIGQ